MAFSSTACCLQPRAHPACWSPLEPCHTQRQTVPQTDTITHNVHLPRIISLLPILSTLSLYIAWHGLTFLGCKDTANRPGCNGQLVCCPWHSNIDTLFKSILVPRQLCSRYECIYRVKRKEKTWQLLGPLKEESSTKNCQERKKLLQTWEQKLDVWHRYKAAVFRINFLSCQGPWPHMIRDHHHQPKGISNQNTSRDTRLQRKIRKGIEVE